MYLRTQTSRGRTYLLLVESHRVEGKVQQKVVARLGRLDQLRESGQLEDLGQSLARLSQKMSVLHAAMGEESVNLQSLGVGGPMVFGRLWEQLGLPDILRTQAAGRKFAFDLERAVFATVLHRLFAPGSDRAAEHWLANYRIPGVENLKLHHLYRAMAFLGKPLPKQEQSVPMGFSPRCIKDRIEEDIFAARSDLLTTLDLVFFDTTSIYFEGTGGNTLGRRGFNKDRRPDRPQVVVGVLLTRDGMPICCEIWPGDTSDARTLLPVVHRLRERFHVRSISLVADRGMISKRTITALGQLHPPVHYILGARLRSVKEVREQVIGSEGEYQQVRPQRTASSDPAPLAVREMTISGRRYVICYNMEQAEMDKANRQAIIDSLRDNLTGSGKSLVGNKGYRRYLKSTKPNVFEIDLAKVEAEARYDGLYVLRTDLDLPAAEIALNYKQLWTVEALFRDLKQVVQARPVYHQSDAAIRGHIFCSYLALVLRKQLTHRLTQAGVTAEWAKILAALESVKLGQLTLDGKSWQIRAQAQGLASKLFSVVGQTLPPMVQQA